MKKQNHLKQKLIELKQLIISEKKSLKIYRTKHDVLEKELRITQIKAIYYYIKMLMLEIKISENKLTSEQLNKESIKILNNIFPFILTSSHMIYENYLDSQKMGLELSKNYLEKAEYSIKLLLFVALLEHNNIYLKDIKDSNLLLQILECKIDSYLLNIFSIDINLKDIDIYKLDLKSQKLLNKYHQNYMKKNIYNKVYSNKVNKSKVLKLNKNISR